MLFWHLLCHENAHIRFSMLRFSFGRSFKIAIVIRFFCFFGYALLASGLSSKSSHTSSMLRFCRLRPA